MPDLSNFRRIGGAWSVAMVMNLALIFALACGGAEETPAAPAQAAPATAFSGTIEIDGSSTVFPVSEAVAEEFHKIHSDVRVNVGVSGTGGGFKRFTAGEIDISDASRLIKDSEAEVAEKNGIEYYPLRVAMDGMSVMVSPDNDFVECLTTDQLKMIWEPGSAVSLWSDVNPSWPSKDIALYGPDTDSGTFDYFTEEIMGEAQLSRPDYTASADDNVLVQGIAGGKYSLGYFGFSYYQENMDKLKLVAVDSGNGCVLPTSESIENGTYAPLSRPLFIYVNKQSMERPEVIEFVEFYLEHAAELAQEVGYIKLGDAEYAANRDMIKQ
ncbi:MAG: PstS family phosphate ABC transporter substrate-binding protein [Chloroflexi bacterium]|nr:PstS family phosphate ABC transporter substrate-binding protein [Chloroflexota bacterium]